MIEEEHTVIPVGNTAPPTFAEEKEGNEDS
jgi:hypothetical protein